MKQILFHISKGDKNIFDGFLRARSPFCEGPSSICDDMEVPLSRDDQYLGSLIDDEEFSYIDEEDEQRINTSAIPLEEEEEEEDQHDGMMRIHPYLFQEVSAQNKETVLRSERRDKPVHFIF